jgi:5,10-methylenetetrahydromethanopterin reductase
VRTGLLSIGDVPWSEITERAQLAEQLGFDHFWVADERFFREPFQLLAMAAGATEHIALGPCVVDPYTRHPALIATAAGTLDEIAGGRAVIVLGAGKSGFREMGVERAHSARRLREAAVLIKELCWRGSADFEGSEVVFRDGRANMPLRAGLPVWIATEGPMTIAAAAEVADAVMVSSAGTRDQVARIGDMLDSAAAHAGRRRIPLHLRMDVVIADDPAEVESVLRPIVLRHFLRHLGDPGFWEQNAVDPALIERLRGINYRGYSRDAESLSALAQAVPGEYIGRFAWGGTGADVAGALAEVADLVDGVTVFPLLAAGQRWADAVRRVWEVMASVCGDAHQTSKQSGEGGSNG